MSTDVSSSRPVILRATIRHRVGVRYDVPPELLTSHLPDPLVPDTRTGGAAVELVGVHLRDVRVLGIAGPGLRHVPAVELRAAVRHPPTNRHGTITLQAYVPRRLVAWGARTLYDEPVAVASMQPLRRTSDDRVAMTYRFDWQGREQRLRVEGARTRGGGTSETEPPLTKSGGWRFATAGGGTLRCARLDQDTEGVRRADTAHVTVRWRAAFGDIGALLADRSPAGAWLGGEGPLALRWREHIE